jgi:hypothetical protein
MRHSQQQLALLGMMFASRSCSTALTMNHGACRSLLVMSDVMLWYGHLWLTAYALSCLAAAEHEKLASRIYAAMPERTEEAGAVTQDPHRLTVFVCRFCSRCAGKACGLDRVCHAAALKRTFRTLTQFVCLRMHSIALQLLSRRSLQARLMLPWHHSTH